MDRFLAMIMLLTALCSLLLCVLALFAVAPVICSCLLSLMYSLYLFMAYEESGVHHAQEFENRFWTIFGLLLSTALFFANDSPMAFGRHWSPSLGFVMVLVSGYGMHVWDRHHHRRQISQQTSLRRGSMGCTSLSTLHNMGFRVEDQLERINKCLKDIDQLFLPSTINNFINERFVLRKEREIISIFEDCDARALNYLVGHVKLALLFYKIKDHRNYAGQNRTQIIQLLAVDRLAILTVMSRVIVLHSLQLLKLKANPRAEHWVRNIILNTNLDDLSKLKTLMDAKGDYFCMTKLIYDDLRSETIRQDILGHIRREAAVQQAHMQMGTKRAKQRQNFAWRKVLSDVDDTLLSSGGSYPAGVDKRYGKKVVYPGVLAFYRELDLGTQGPDEWPENRVGNLVFLSARPHVYKDMSEKANFAKFEKMRAVGEDGRKGMHTVPSLLAGDLASGTNFMVTNDFEHLALKKFDNFKRYVSIFPEYKHVFVADNGQGDVRAGDMMFDQYPYELEGLYVHVVQERSTTFGYQPEEFRKKGFRPCFFHTYPEAAIHAATIAEPPMISMKGMRRICLDATKDFKAIAEAKWATPRTKAERRLELNQSIWRANFILETEGLDPVPLIEAEILWQVGEKVRTPYGIGTILSFDSTKNLYEVDLDWRPLNEQLEDHLAAERKKKMTPRSSAGGNDSNSKLTLETVVETEETEEDPKKAKEEGEDGENEVLEKSGEDSSNQPENQPEGPDNNTKDAANGNNEEKSSSTEETNVKPQRTCKAKAWVAGHQITKYTPPVLPKIDKKREKIFTFWSPPAKKKSPFQPGAHCTTPFGSATVAEYRPKERIVVVDMVGWTAKAYLQEDVVKIVSKGMFRNLFRNMSGNKAPAKPKDFPYAEGTVIQTPYGKGAVSKPLPITTKASGRSDAISPKAATPKAITPTNNSKPEAAATGRPRSGSLGSSAAAPVAVPTIGISLTSWTLADGSHPVLYCTVPNAQTWKERHDRKGLISATVALVGSTLGKLRVQQASKKPKKEEKEDTVPLQEQYFQDAAKVSTHYGLGTVSGFRPTDGFYKISLSNWTLSDGSHPVAYLKKDDIRIRIANACQEGYPVYVKYGLTGTLASVQPKTGVHVVTIPSAGMVCYLQPEDVLRPIKASVGEEVLTAYGEGVVERYRFKDDTYQIRLKHWNGAKLYAKAETFDRVDDGVHDKGNFGMKWLLSMFFSSNSNSKAGTMTRSRSNSVTSGLSRATS